MREHSWAAMADALPTFRFHPAPEQSGAVERSPASCRACGRARGWIYTGPCYGETDLDDELCPWCIADGTAHAKFGASFHDMAWPEDTAAADRDEIEQRTPGFATFNPFDWPACCGAPMAYLEPAGIGEVRARHRELEGQLMATIVHELGVSGGAARTLLESLHRDHSPSVHVFGCIRCDTRRAHIDFV